jgi:translocation and assembly module TamB
LGALSLHLTLDGPRDAVQAQLSVHGGALQGSAAGSVNLNTRAAVLQVKLDAPAMSPRPDLSWRSLSLHGSWSGTLAAPNTIAQLQLAGLVAGPLQLAALSADLHGEGDALALDATLGGLVLPQPWLGILAAAPLQLHAQAKLGDAARPVDFTLSHPLLDARGRWSKTGVATASAELKDIGPLAALAAVKLTGRGTLAAQLKTSGRSRQLNVNGELAVDGGDPVLVHLLAPRAKLSASLAFSDNNFQIERSQLQATKIQL